jgi:outer membrane protein OmpA-like peptidoglycan-associated protein
MNPRFPLAPRSTTIVMTGVALLLLPPFARLARADRSSAPARDPLPTQAGDFALKIEPGLAIPLTDPQARLFKLGGGQTLKALWAVSRYLDLGPSASFIYLPSKTSPNDPGTAWAFGGGARIKRPHDSPDSDDLQSVSPWLDLDLLYVRTGDLDRAGFAAAAGFALPIGKSRSFWLGPFVRYLHIIDGVRAGFDDGDGKILSVGLSLEIGSGVERPPEPAPLAPPPPAPVAAPACPACPACPAPVEQPVPVCPDLCPDRDKDQIPDSMDHCPDIAGPMETGGCPPYKKIVIRRDKLELKERLYFAWGEAKLQDVSFPVLDEVVQALKDNKSFHVQVEGHTSSEGGDERNQTLSEKRAEAVLDYLVSHGVDKERLKSKGFGSSVPRSSNATPAGREKNRRVEFLVHFTILNEKAK